MKIIILKGGLGNQLFQFCLYLELINQNYKEKVLIDNKTGFLLDFTYKRNFEIKHAICKKDLNSKLNSFLNILLILSKKFHLNKFFEILKIKIIDDNKFSLDQTISSFKKKQNYILFDGYFHNFSIVDKNKSELIKFINPYLSKKVNNNFENLYKKILSEKNSVALCIRFYEETKNPTIYAFEGRETQVSQFNKVIKEIEKKLINPHFFIFVQNNNKFLDQLKINSNSTLISHDNGFIGSWERLRAQSYCKHHIFNNSTFYYWGAIFSKYMNNNKDYDQIIYASNNFFFKDIYNPEWEIF